MRIELADLVDDARLLLLGMGRDLRDLRRGKLRILVGRDLCLAWLQDPPECAPAIAEIAAGPSVANIWLSTPACCVEEDWPNICPTMLPKSGVCSERMAAARPAPISSVEAC